MDAATLSHLIQRISSTPVKTNPYHHFHAERMFPDTFYNELIENIPDTAYFSQLKAYPQRFSLDLIKEQLEQLPFTSYIFWQNFATAIWSETFAYALLKKFQPQLKERYGEDFLKIKVGVDASLIRDQSEYSIGPHTDHPNKLITLLFYLPTSREQKHLGTSIYSPKDRSFKCKGHEHYSFKDFDKVATVPFVPNSICKCS